MEDKTFIKNIGKDRIKLEQIGFIGAYDKKDLLINVAKVLCNLNKKVLIVDATTMQRLRYIVPRISNATNNTYVSDYMGIDVALGFMNFNGIMQYLGQALNYDYALIDTDNIQTLNSFMLPKIAKNFFVTSYDEYELQRGLEIFKFLQQPLEIYKLIYSANINNKEEEYLNHLLKEVNITWKKEKIEFADTINDRKAILENQISKDVSFKKFSGTYRDSLEYLVSLIAGDYIQQSEIRKTIKSM